MNKLPLSVTIVSYNEEKNIENTLQSIVDIANEIIIVDSFSTDKTCDIAQRYNAKIFKEEWKGHVIQKNSALEKSTEDWILAIDCDEVVSDELKKEIIRVINEDKYDGLLINRKTFYLGKFLNYAWQPDWKLRIVKRLKSPRWGGIDPHDKLYVDGITDKLAGELYHYSYKDLQDHFISTVKYAKIAADAYEKKGKKFSLCKLLFNPVFKFFRSYFIRLGFLDGIRGLIVSISAFLYTLLKYSYLWEIKLKSRK